MFVAERHCPGCSADILPISRRPSCDRCWLKIPRHLRDAILCGTPTAKIGATDQAIAELRDLHPGRNSAEDAFLAELATTPAGVAAFKLLLYPAGTYYRIPSPRGPITVKASPHQSGDDPDTLTVVYPDGHHGPVRISDLTDAD
jgi:hypothetical protein